MMLISEKSGGFCGNMRVDGNEECDPGPGVKKDLDPCCNKFCQFRDGKQCSDVNDICCEDCFLRQIRKSVTRNKKTRVMAPLCARILLSSDHVLFQRFAIVIFVGQKIMLGHMESH